MKTNMMVIGIVTFVMSAAQVSRAADWKLNCKDDQMEDIRTCTIHGDAVYVIGMAWQQNSSTMEFVTVGYDKYPGSDLVFRVDQNPPIRWPDSETAGRSAELIKQMTEGRRLMSRYTKWPHGTTVDGTDTLSGFTAKLEEMRQRLREYGGRSN